MEFNIPKQHMGYERAISEGLKINFDYLGFFNMHSSAVQKMNPHSGAWTTNGFVSVEYH